MQNFKPVLENWAKGKSSLRMIPLTMIVSICEATVLSIQCKSILQLKLKSADQDSVGHSQQIQLSSSDFIED